MRGYGPYNDQEIYNFLIKLNMNKDNQVMKSKLMVLEKNSDIFYTIDACLEELNKTMLLTFNNPLNNNIMPLINNQQQIDNNDFTYMKNSKEISRPVYTRRYSKFNENNNIPNNINKNLNQFFINNKINLKNLPKFQRRISLNYYNNNKKEFKQGNYFNKNKIERNYNRKYTYTNTKPISELDKLFALNENEKKELNNNNNKNVNNEVKEVVQKVDIDSIFS